MATSTYFCIPCFLMLTGAFISNRVLYVKVFYINSLKKLGIPTFIFSLGYSIWYCLLSTRKGLFQEELIKQLKLWGSGWAGHPLWYMYMLIGVYLLIPYIIKAINDLQINEIIFALLFCIWASLSAVTSSFSVTYNLGKCILWCAYVTAGYVIKNNIHEKSNRKAFLLIIFGFSLLAVNSFFVYNSIILNHNKGSWANEFTPFIMIGSILIFSGFTYLSLNKDIKTC